MSTVTFCDVSVLRITHSVMSQVTYYGNEWFIIVVFSITLTLLIIASLDLRLRLRLTSFREFNNMVQTVFNSLNKRIRELEKETTNLNLKFEAYTASLNEFKNRSDEYEEKIRNLTEGLKDILKAQVNIIKVLKTFDRKIFDLSRKVRGRSFRVVGQSYPESMDSPKMRNRSVEIAKLTPTEITVLRLLATSGPKTASEIREVIGKTREHSSRLMKKLFLEGYVERDTTTIPYVYKISEKIRESFELSS